MCLHFDRPGDAEELYKSLIDVKTRVNGPGHESTLVARHNLAVCYTHLNRGKEARNIFRPVIKIAARKLGKTHLVTMAMKHNFAILVHNMGQYRKAMHMMKELIKISEETFGLEAPKTKGYSADLGRWRKEYKTIPFFPWSKTDPDFLDLFIDDIQEQLNSNAKS